MKLSYFTVSVSYKGELSGHVAFTDGKAMLTQPLDEVQKAELNALVDKWKIELIDKASNNLANAKRDLLAIENSIPGHEVPF